MKQRVKTMLALLLGSVLCLGMATTVFAEETEPVKKVADEFTVYDEDGEVTVQAEEMMPEDIETVRKNVGHPSFYEPPTRWVHEDGRYYLQIGVNSYYSGMQNIPFTLFYM